MTRNVFLLTTSLFICVRKTYYQNILGKLRIKKENKVHTLTQKLIKYSFENITLEAVFIK